MKTRTMPRWLSFATIPVLVVWAHLLPSGLAGEPPAFADVILFESRGQLESAVELAEALRGGLDEKQVAHVEKLQAVLRALGRASLLERAGLRDQALGELDGIRKELGTENDLYLILEIQKSRTALTAPERAAAQRKLEFARALLEAGKTDKALEELNPLVKLHTPEQISSADHEAALSLLSRAEILQNAPTEPGVLAEIGDAIQSAARTVTQWIFYFLVLIAAYFLGTRVPRVLGRRPGTLVGLDDWTAPEEKREEKGRELTGELSSAIRRIEAPSAAADSPLLNWDSTELVFGLGSTEGVASLSTYVQETDVAVGPIKFNARQLFALIASLFRPRHQYALTGTLSSTGPKTQLTVERRDASGKPIRGAVFSAAAEGEQARSQVVRAVAAQVALFLSKNKAVTDNWRSLEQLLLAEEQLGREVAPAERRNTLKTALDHLESALRHDHANWIARIQLAAVLRQLGRFQSSADQYEYLHLQLINSRVLGESPHFQTFLRAHPDFPTVLRYNEAVSRCRVGRRSETAKATRIVSELFKELKTTQVGDKPASAKEQVPGPRLEMLARSLRAECWARRIEHSRDEQQTDEQNRINGQLVREIVSDEQWMWTQVSSLERSQLSEYTYAHMVTRNALGRAYYLTGRYRKAEKFFRWAIDFHLDAPNVAAKLNLASLYIRRKRRISPLWITEAESLLNDVISIDPENSKANYLLGRLCAHPAVNRLDEAKKWLEAAGDDALSIFERARIAIEVEHDLAAGLNLARRSILLDPEPSYRHYFIVSEVLKHLEADGDLDIEDLEFALDVATRLGRARTSGFRSKATEAMTVFKQKLEVLSKTAVSENDRDDEEEPEVRSDADDDAVDETDETMDSV